MSISNRIVFRQDLYVVVLSKFSKVITLSEPFVKRYIARSPRLNLRSAFAVQGGQVGLINLLLKIRKPHLNQKFWEFIKMAGIGTLTKLSSKQAARKNKPHSGKGNALTSEEKVVGRTLKKAVSLTEEELESVNTRRGLLELLNTKNVNVNKALTKLPLYEQELERLQIELVKAPAIRSTVAKLTRGHHLRGPGRRE
ncbi:MAG: hypothetical protein R3F37_11225 [Candidatus Competibacteraceae bacterium]